MKLYPINYGYSRLAASGRGESRILFVAACFIILFAAISIRMASIASGQHGGSPRRSMAQTYQRSEIVDRQGRILAMNMATHSLYAHPQDMVDPMGAAKGLSKIFDDLDSSKLEQEFLGDRKFIWLEQTMSPEQMQAVFDLGEPGLLFGDRLMRLFPNGALAGHILGGTRFGAQGVDQAEIIGVAGVEDYFDDWLRDPDNDAAPLQLSIDLTIQNAMEDVLANALSVMNAKGAASVLLDVNSGEILAMSSLPDFDPNARPSLSPEGDPAQSTLFNRAVQGQYEFGSAFKLFPVAQALDLGLIRPDTLIDTAGPLKLGGFNIHDSHDLGPNLSATDVLVHSSNIGAVHISQLIGADRQKEFLRKLGLFDPSPIEVAEASFAKPLVPAHWPEVTSATVSYGHGIATSMVNLAAAYATIANHGVRVQPTLVHGLQSAPGERIISTEAADQAMEMLRQVVTRGTGSRADVLGYEVGGKTGTADKANPAGGYYHDRVIATFAAVFPTSAPKFVLITTLEEPSLVVVNHIARGAGLTAAPVVGALIERLGPLLKM